MVLPAAAASLTWLSPGAGAVVSGPVDLAVRTDRQVGETVDGVTVRLSTDGETIAPGTRTRELRCAESDGCNRVGQQQDRWGLVELDPDGGELATGPVCNGQYVLQAQQAGTSAWAGTPVVLTGRTVQAPSGLAADGEPRAAQLSWTPPASAGDVRLRVERRVEGASAWDAITVLPGSASSYTDSGVAAGTYDYRVVSTRGDGFVAGRPAAACTDSEPDLTAASQSRTVTVAPGPSSGSTTASDGTTDDAMTGADEDGTAASTSGDGSDPGTPSHDGAQSGDADGEDADGSTADDDISSSGGTPRSGTRVAAPPPPRRGDSAVRAPEIARSRGGEGTYYGQDDPFSEELGYDQDPAAPLAGEQPDETSAIGRFIPGGTRTLTQLHLDRRQVVLPIAAGLLLLVSGMHLRRWMGEA